MSALWLVSYVGEKVWNITDVQVVRAPTEARARRVSCYGPPSDWKVEPVQVDGDDDVILSSWKGDPN